VSVETASFGNPAWTRHPFDLAQIDEMFAPYHAVGAARANEMSTRFTANFLGGNKGALRIPSLSFQYLRRPGRTAKLLCFHTVGAFDPHRPYQIFFFIQ